MRAIRACSIPKALDAILHEEDRDEYSDWSYQVIMEALKKEEIVLNMKVKHIKIALQFLNDPPRDLITEAYTLKMLGVDYRKILQRGRGFYG